MGGTTAQIITITDYGCAGLMKNENYLAFNLKILIEKG